MASITRIVMTNCSRNALAWRPASSAMWVQVINSSLISYLLQFYILLFSMAISPFWKYVVYNLRNSNFHLTGDMSCQLQLAKFILSSDPHRNMWLQESMDDFVFLVKCSYFVKIARSLNKKSTVDQQTLQSLWGCLGDNHWAQSVLRSLSMDRQIKTDQIFHIWDSRLGPKASFMKGVERGILNIANYIIVRC